MIICDQRPPGAHKEEPLGADKWTTWMKILKESLLFNVFFSSKKGFVTSFKSFTFNILCSGILLIFSTYAGGSSKRHFYTSKHLSYGL